MTAFRVRPLATVIALSVFAGIVLTAGPSGAAPRCDVTLTNSGDRYNDTSDSHTICALDGADAVYGHDGDDTIYGGQGKDYRVSGNAGDDTLFGDPGRDVVDGGFGVDSMLGEKGDDTIRAADGTTDAEVNGGAGTDTCFVDASDPTVNCETVVIQ
jgi:Ca2+-binding RTX toxin-like protein